MGTPEFVGRLLLSIAVQIAIGRYYPVLMDQPIWWITTLPIATIICLLIIRLIKS